MKMNFQRLLEGAEVLAQQGDPEIAGLDYDSRRVKPGFAFVAMHGESTDGNRFINKALSAGAVAVISDSASEAPRPGVAWAQVPHGRRALARLSANFYRRPAEKLRITGITGTNGKTTTTFIVESILKAAGRRSSLVGTVEYHLPGETLPAPHTTPESLELNQLFSRALGNGATESVMEVSSHALAQQRVFAIPFDVAIFSNLTRDHLDYHKTMDEYFASKRILFEGCGTDPPRVDIINIDDEYGRKLIDFSKKKSSDIFTYGLEKGDFRAQRLDISTGGNRFDLVTPTGTVPLFSPMRGRVNVYNVLAASAATYARGCSLDQIANGVGVLKRVPGRFESVDEGQPFSVVVDYAHTDDALKNLTSLAREFVSKAGGRVITVFGCGGDRDRAKRPIMGEAAGNGSDFVVLTSDNPRSEDPLAIMNDALPGLQRTHKSYALEPDRRKAIAKALGEAQTGDIVLIAGKGHERTQTTREGVFPFDDFSVAREELNRLGYQK
jgi:UDP-N-acetylmuramoyl-L-alanyl-D-glutamate--2,6-diaminopimelate ligase